ncbi:MAG TPA: rhomboid family intramembrane serine protease [Chitinophagaceae bacterium]|jgi:membrane associated rhomboid family serine protease|nr:rhomboid family intramembrane serine protease [Chitinophagaceae bacterium]
MFNITLSIIIITSVISLAGFRNGKVVDDLIFWPPAINKKYQYYRFITCGLIHADYIHLIFNMLTLYFFGTIMEVYYQGQLGLQKYYYLALYIGALIVSNIPTYLKHRNDYDYRSLGASGAVSAVLFAFILLRPWQQIIVLVFPVPAIIYGGLFLFYSAYMSRKGGDHINHDAHFYGALFGVLFTIAIRPGVLDIFMNELKHPHF